MALKSQQNLSVPAEYSDCNRLFKILAIPGSAHILFSILIIQEWFQIRTKKHKCG